MLLLLLEIQTYMEQKMVFGKIGLYIFQMLLLLGILQIYYFGEMVKVFLLVLHLQHSQLYNN